MANEMDAATTLIAVPELGVPENPVSPASKDVNGVKISDLFVLGLNVNASVSEGEVSMGNEEVAVQKNETGFDVSQGLKDAEYYFHVANVVEEGDKDDGLPEVLEPSFSEELFDCSAMVPGESDVGERGIEDFRDALMELDSEVGYPDSAADYTERCNFSVGDLVWGKIRSHPWWPGQICAPPDASDVALKLKKKGQHLVAYYGDASFSWCLPSQLIPFAEHFEEMSKQSSSRTFVNAVQQAVDEIGRLVELELTCSCVPDANQMGLTRPMAVNAGIKSGVLMPEGDIGKLLSFRYDPSEVLMVVSSIAQSVSFASSLELSILKGWLSAFYRVARGGFTLPVYYEPLFVIGLEDSVQSNVEEQNDLNTPIEVPLQGSLKEDWVSPDLAGDKDYLTRKQKSNKIEPTNRKRQDRKEKDENLKADNGVLRKKEMQDSEPSKPDIPIGESNDSEGSKGYEEEMSSTRSRRKSKYLSPPFTSYDQVVAEEEEKANFSRVGERIKAAAEQLFDSSPLSMNRVGMTYKKIIKAVDAVASENEILSGLVSVASSPVHPWNTEMLKLTREFFSAFRSSKYLDGVNYKLYHNKQLEIDKDEDFVKNLTQTENTGTKKRKEELNASNIIGTTEKSYNTPKRQKVAAKEEANSIGLEKNVSLTSSLVLTVPRESSLPSKYEIVRKFSEYGHVNEEETVVLSNFCRVKILHDNSAGVEGALRELLQGNPFGCKTVDYKILYRSDAPMVAVVDSNLPSDPMPHLGFNGQMET